MTKRLFDIILSAVALLLVSPILAVTAVVIKIDSRGPILFRQERIGRRFEPFMILKLRTMTVMQDAAAPQITARGDSRVTRIGRVLRKMKIDEIPQLVNVLRGEMSLVGPRPEVRRYVEMYRSDFEEILRVRPGITDLASIEYRDEEAVLAAANDLEAEYREVVLPAKIRLAKAYVRDASLLLDARLIARTILEIFAPARSIGGGRRGRTS